MNYRKNWFYRLCLSELKVCAAALILFCILTVVGIVILVHGINIRAIILVVLCGILTAGLLVSIIRRSVFGLTRVRKQLKNFGDDLPYFLGDTKPQCAFGNFYIGERYLCIPREFLLIDYRDIEDVAIEPRYSSGQIVSYDAVFTLSDNSIKKVDILKWKGQESGFGGFIALIRSKADRLRRETDKIYY